MVVAEAWTFGIWHQPTLANGVAHAPAWTHVASRTTAFRMIRLKGDGPGYRQHDERCCGIGVEVGSVGVSIRQDEREGR